MLRFVVNVLIAIATLSLAELNAKQPAQVNKTKLVFAVNDPGSPPYIFYHEQTKSYQGIVIDFFQSFEKDEQFNLKFIDSSRARNELLILEGKADLFLSSPDWLTNPEKLLFSETLLLHSSYLYSLNEFNQSFALESLPQNFICTRRGYVYPTLTQHFNDQKLVRLDSSSQLTMANMLIKGRCDYVVMNEFNAQAELKNKSFCDITFHQSPRSIHDTPLVFVVTSGIEPLLPIINQQLNHFRQSGQLEKSMRRHGGDTSFPLKNHCL